MRTALNPCLILEDLWLHIGAFQKNEKGQCVLDIGLPAAILRGNVILAFALKPLRDGLGVSSHLPV